jgi:thiamine monophosphate kinase
MDSSDGVCGCLFELALVNGVDIVVNSESLHPHAAVRQVAAAAEIDARTLMLAWGNWELVCIVPPEVFDDVRGRMESIGTPCYDIGEVCEGGGQVWVEDAEQRLQLSNFASERFAGTSYFTYGLDAYVRLLREQPLTTGRLPSG